ncbi:MAG: endonuclease/exonuclease/phosphatase family protein [Candidatus Izemoplasmatales bacterium]|jgi:endonuclease/exonuclease/phosphatase family metal-dependent hydrolase
MKRIAKILMLLILTAISFVIVFILVLQIFEYRPDPLVQLEITDNLTDESQNHLKLDTTYKILSFNVGYASLSQTEDFVMDGGAKARMDTKSEVEANIDGIKQILEDSEADIYLLQEVDEDSARSYHINQYSAFKDALGMPSSYGYNYRCLFVPFPLDFSHMMGEVNSGIASFTSFRVNSAIRHQLPGSFAWPVNLANLKRCLVVSKLPIADSSKYLVIINAHLSAYDDGSMRLKEMAYLQEVMQAETKAGNYVIVGGDFNQTFPQALIDGENETNHYLYPLKNPEYWEAFPMNADWFLENGFTFGVDVSTPTCRLLHQPYDTDNHENNQYYVIDGFIVSDNIDILGVETLDLDFLYSDHNPVMMEIKLIP